MLPRVWSSLLNVKIEVLGVLVSGVSVTFFSPSPSKNNSNLLESSVLAMVNWLWGAQSVGFDC